MSYSSIVRRMCKCGCGKPPTIGFAGYNQNCNPEKKKEILAKLKAKQSEASMLNRPPKERKQIKKSVRSSVRGLISSDANKQVMEGEKSEITPINQWYMDRRLEMTNCCIECGRSTNKIHDKYYRWSVCHIVPKSLVPSVATNEYNWVELCQLHHQEFDNTFDKAAAMMCFGEVKMKFQLFKNLIPTEELRKVNPHLLT